MQGESIENESRTTSSRIGMIDVSGKPVSYREALAEGCIRLREESRRILLEKGFTSKGHIETIASIAAITAVKKTPELIPHTHNIPIESVETSLEVLEDCVKASVRVKTSAKTGAEMEALAGVMAALLALWDVLKKYEKDSRGQYPYTEIYGIRVVEKKKIELLD